LLNHGIGLEVEKYDLTFFGVDFLLGPDRDNLISTEQLFVRWVGVHCLAIFGLAFGAGLCFNWSRASREGEQLPVVSPGPGVSASAAPGKEFRLYREQVAFLRAQSQQTGKTVNELAEDILTYFARELSDSPGSVDAVRGYLERSRAGDNKSFAQRPVHLQLSGETGELFALVDPQGAHSRSRVFRKLLEIFMAAAEDEMDKEQDEGAIVT